ncbi:MAG: hypothetical protein E7552_07000 [Ruminococcaceae bacterium]|nr:hypothetical protein [Oscillospiraceae bacterium]
MCNEEQKDLLLTETEETTETETVVDTEETSETQEVTETEETAETEEDSLDEDGGIVDEDPFENAFQYTEEDAPKTSNWPVAVLAVLLVLVLVGGVLWSTGIFNKKPANGGDGAATVEPFGVADVSDAIAATCQDIKVSNGAIAFFMEMEYQNSDQYTSYDKTKPLKGQDTAAYDALVSSAKKQFEWMLTLNASAEKRGNELNKAAQNMIEKATLSVDVSKFHNGVTADDVREFYTLYYTAWIEESALFNKVTMTDEKINELYEEYALDFQTCSVASFLFYVDENGTYKTVEEATAATAALTDCKTPEAFRAAAVKLMVDNGECQTKEEAEKKYDSTYLAEGVGYNEEYDIAKWLFSEDTKVGDTKVVTGEDYVTVYMLTVAPAKNTAPLANVYHLFLSTDSYGDPTALDALEKQVLDEWQAGENTAEAFRALVRKYTADFNTYDGSFWELQEQPSVNEAFTAWCFDEARKAGDVTAIDSDYGCHILYYVGMDEVWRAQVLSTMQNDASNAAVNELPKTFPVSFQDETIGTIVL